MPVEQNSKPKIDVGDLIQVEIDGVLALDKPARVRAVQEYEGSPWVFIEDSEAGIPMDQVVLEQKGNANPPPNPTITPPRLPLPPQINNPSTRPPRDGWSEERLLDDAGEEILISYRGEPSIGRYEFIRDFLNFKLSRMKKPGERREQFSMGGLTFEIRATPVADRWLIQAYQDGAPLPGAVGVPYSVIAEKPGIDVVGERMESERKRIEHNLRMTAARPAELGNASN